MVKQHPVLRALRGTYLLPIVLALWWPVAFMLFLMFGLFQRNSVLLLLLTGLYGAGLVVGWLALPVALWQSRRVGRHWSVWVYVPAQVFFFYLVFALKPF